MAIAYLDRISLHGKSYKLPTRPTVVVCIDGFTPAYLNQGIKDGILLTLAEFAKTGFYHTAKVAMPSFTNPNNVSIITGQPTAVHGISGNYFLDTATGTEAMIVDDGLLRGSTILAEMAAADVRVAAITAKDKLRRILQHGLPLGNEKSRGCISFSAEEAPEEILSQLPAYESRPSYKADLFCLTLSDFIQHKYAPGSTEANKFMAAIDSRIGQLVELGAVVAVTGDHGMSDKCSKGGNPNIVFVQDELEAKFGVGCARVICPITDPFVRHHGALGGFVRVYLPVSRSTEAAEMVAYCRTLEHVEEALLRDEAVSKYEKPADREGDFTVVSRKNAVVGSKATEHDLGSISDHRLRSHRGLSEQAVPLLMSRPVEGPIESLQGKVWRNFDIFDLLLNYGQ